MSAAIEGNQRTIVILLGVLIVAGASILLLSFIRRAAPMPPAKEIESFARATRSKSHMKLESPDFQQGDSIPAIYTCDGENMSPPLRISGVPENARSLALIVDDPDATSGTWVHWVVWNIPPDTKIIKAGVVTENAVEGLTSFDRPGYGGPCPPSGTHRYMFKLFALSEMLLLTPDNGAAALEEKIIDYLLDKAGLYGTYRRP